MTIKDIGFRIAMVLLGWILIYKLNFPEVIRKILRVDESESSKYKRFITSDRYFKIVFWFIAILVLLGIIIDITGFKGISF